MRPFVIEKQSEKSTKRQRAEVWGNHCSWKNKDSHRTLRKGFELDIQAQLLTGPEAPTRPLVLLMALNLILVTKVEAGRWGSHSVAERLLGMWEALGSSPSTTNTKQKSDQGWGGRRQSQQQRRWATRVQAAYKLGSRRSALRGVGVR